jgi:GNAT superfamily N-acetyltransferase
MAAGCVAVRIDPERIGDPDRWLDALEAGVLPWNARPRLYLPQPSAPLERAMAERGYGRTVERGFLFCDAPQATGRSLSLIPVDDDAGWLVKERIHERCLPSPHTKAGDAGCWTALERAKARAGYMVPFLVYASGVPCGSLSLAATSTLVRIKNVVVLPEWRRRGVATAMIAAAVGEAHRRGKVGAGLFAVADTVGEIVYVRRGAAAIGEQYEWIR